MQRTTYSYYVPSTRKKKNLQFPLKCFHLAFLFEMRTMHLHSVSAERRGWVFWKASGDGAWGLMQRSLTYMNIKDGVQQIAAAEQKIKVSMSCRFEHAYTSALNNFSFETITEGKMNKSRYGHIVNKNLLEIILDAQKLPRLSYEP